MIRAATPADTDEIVSLWLAASREAHSFIPYEYWAAHESDMRDLYIPNSETYVAVSDGNVQGYVSLRGDHLHALFVEPASQGRGTGSSLLEYVQSIRTELTLAVYVENERACGFYRRHGFVETDVRVDPDTAQREAVMTWTRHVG